MAAEQLIEIGFCAVVVGRARVEGKAETWVVPVVGLRVLRERDCVVAADMDMVVAMGGGGRGGFYLKEERRRSEKLVMSAKAAV